jgi:hypothetical protein
VAQAVQVLELWLQEVQFEIEEHGSHEVALAKR